MTILRSGVGAIASSLAPSTEYGARAKLNLRGSSIYSYLQVGLPSDLRKGATVQSATLRLQQSGSWSGTPTVTVQAVAAKWLVSKLNWGNKPATIAGTGHPVTQAGGADLATWAFDMTSDVQDWVDGVRPNYGWRISSTTSSTQYFRGFLAGSGKPTLEVVYNYAPAAPTSLHPSAGAVSVAKPVLRWDAGDVASVQVQVDPAANGTTPAFDSGVVAAVQNQFDLSSSSYAGLSAGASTQWRVRVTNTAGLTSPWSQWATFSRVAKPTLTVTQPTGTVLESTPPIAWTFAGQAAYRVLIARASSPTVYVHDSGKRAGSSGSYTPPAPVFTVDGASYVTTVRAYDSVVREVTPGDPDYVEASVTSTLSYEASVSGVAWLSAAQPSLAPWVDLTWSRAVMPDGWAVIRDGEVIHVEPVAADLLASGTTYSWRDWTAAPNREHIYRVAPVVNGATSSAGPLELVSMTTAGIWLGDPESGLDVVLLGRDEVAAAYGEESESFVPIGASSTVSVVSGMRGLEGSASGLVTDALGRVGADEVAGLYALKGEPSTVVRMAWADVNIPVVLRNVQPTPQRANTSTAGGVTRLVTFDFLQTGELPYSVDL